MMLSALFDQFAYDVMNAVRGEIARWTNARPKRMIGLVDGYNDGDHTVKVKLLTELDDNGQPKITGWIPFGTQAGSQQGISFVVGPNIGDQVVIDHAEGDAEGSHVSHVLHNTVDTPPKTASGQAVMQHNPTGNFFTINTDGSMQHFHKATGNYVMVDKSGNIITRVTSTAQQHFVGGDPSKGDVMVPLMLADGTPCPYAKGRKS